MTDNKGLYFISIIERALDSNDPASALKGAFKKITELGRNREYQQGFLQFQAFLRSCIKAYLSGAPDREQSIHQALYRLLHDLATDSFEGAKVDQAALIQFFQRNDRWRTEYERLKTELTDLQAPSPPIQIEILKDGRLIESFDAAEIPIEIKDIEPGHYTTRLSTGRILWEGLLREQHLLWLQTHGDEDLRLAAGTEDQEAEPTISELLIKGELRLEVLPGLKSGKIRIDHGR
jgi:hypothetical protein